jgi:cytoskeletal protein RodZ
LAHSGESPNEERSSLAVRIWRVVVVVLLILALLLVLAYCLTEIDNEGEGTATPVTSATAAPKAPASTAGRTSSGPTKPATTSKPGPGTSRPGAARTGSGAAVGSPTRARTGATPTITESATATENRAAGRTAVPPRAAPNTGGGSLATGPDLILVLTGVMLLISSAGLGLFTVRRWRRAW